MSRKFLHFSRFILSILSIAALFGGSPVHAAANSPAKVQEKAYVQLMRLKTNANKNIASRLTSLHTLSTRIRAMKGLAESEKTKILGEIQANVTDLADLKVKVDRETDSASLVSDMQNASTTYKVSNMVSRASIEASVGRVTSIIGMMSNIGVKFQKRLSLEQSKGKNVSSLESVLADFNARLKDAALQISEARTAAATLDFSSAQTDVKNATADLQAARADISVLLRGLRAL
ncbi:MAG TPA: hypothetical protein VFT82_03200 [Candidatus Paceibacterota bacterium]|nr:hypothetical protein [Candidatus Paceibacterota bacterium]